MLWQVWYTPIACVVLIQRSSSQLQLDKLCDIILREVFPELWRVWKRRGQRVRLWLVVHLCPSSLSLFGLSLSCFQRT